MPIIFDQPFIVDHAPHGGRWVIRGMGVVVWAATDKKLAHWIAESLNNARRQELDAERAGG